MNIKVRVVRFIAILFASLYICNLAIPVFAATLPAYENEALTNWTNWVPCSPLTTVESVTPGITINNQAAQQVAQKASTGGTKVGYAIYDSTGKSMGSYNIFENYGASITKSMLLVAYLNQVGAGTLDPAAQSELTAMIEQSDDNAANQVYKLLNNPSSEIQAVAQQAGMTGLKLNTSDPLYILGQSQIRADDFAKFFAKIDTMFPSSQHDFALQLLSHVTPNAGLLQAGLPDPVLSKEGWKPEPDNTNPFGREGAPYIVNQAAQFSSVDTTYGVAVTVSGTANEQSGETIIKNVVSALVSQKGAGQTSTTSSSSQSGSSSNTNSSSTSSSSTTGGSLSNSYIPAGGKDVGASDFTDPSGYHGDSLAGTWSYAELGMGSNLGNLPYKQKLAITYHGKTVVAEKLDIGAGGSDVNGHRRDIDLHVDKTAQYLGFNGLDVVHVQLVPDSTPLGPTNGAMPSSSGTSTCSCSSSGSTDNFGPGTLPSYVKEPYNKIFTAAAAKFKVDPAVLVAIFYNEQYGYTNSLGAFKAHQWPNPPPPYGSGAPWSTSSAQAQGAFQFIPGTWKSAPPVDGNGDGKADPEDLTDEAFTAAEGFSNGLFGGVKLTVSSSASDVAKMAGYYYGDGQTGPGSYGGAAGQIFQAIKKDEGGGSSSTSTSSTSTSTSSSASSGSSGGSCSSSSGASCSNGSTTATGDAAILCEAEQYKGIYYLFGGGHVSYATFRQQCPLSALPGAASKSTAGNQGPCATDCSGLVSVALDQAFNQSYTWTVQGGQMQGSGAQYWKSIPVSQAQAGDIVTLSEHVEIVDHVSGSTVVTFGSHHTGTQTGQITTPTSYWTGAYHWTGPGS